MICVYLLKSLKDWKNYLGSTKDFKNRLEEHYCGKVPSTKYRRPFILVGYQKCDTIREAVRLEKVYKKSHGALERVVKRGKFTIRRRGVV